jgi:hypothetical protein
MYTSFSTETPWRCITTITETCRSVCYSSCEQFVGYKLVLWCSLRWRCTIFYRPVPAYKKALRPYSDCFMSERGFRGRLRASSKQPNCWSYTVLATDRLQSRISLCTYKTGLRKRSYHFYADHVAHRRSTTGLSINSLTSVHAYEDD